ncbi:MAG: hypothetical protein D6677_08815 [Calditrichaeota bacterium]|nr:MAG: hypothetical protein D6677_08815 [Calditrichota bacterium]
MRNFKRNIIISLSGIYLLACTNPFTTRENQVEKPGSGSDSGIYLEPTQPENILINLSRAIEQKNISKYMENFADPARGAEISFRFVGDAAFQDQLIGRWNLTDEETWFRNLVLPEDKPSPVIRFSYPDSLPVFQPINSLAFEDSVETNLFRYRFTVETTDSVAQYEGFARMRLFRSQQSAREAWLIYYWQDIALQDQAQNSWTALKIRNR